MTDAPTPTRVVFRRYRKEGDIIAILLDVAANPGYVVCYQHIGQHGEGKYWGIMADSRRAAPEEYAQLKKELEQIGYIVHVRKRRTIQGQQHTDTYRAQATRTTPR